MIVVEPIALTNDTAVLRRRDYDALIKATRMPPTRWRWQKSGRE